MKSDMRKTALVTGGSRGIGRAIAETLANSGFDVVIAGSSSEEAARDVLSACEKSGVRAIYVQGDIGSAEGRRAIFDGTRKQFGRLDVLVNNAGVAPKERVDILQATEESFDRVVGINMKGPYFLTQLVANWMIESKGQIPGGYNPVIVNIGSLSAYVSSTARGEYCMSKAGVSMMTILFADRLSEYGINVYEIRPGIIETDMTEKVKDKYDAMIDGGITPIKRWGKPDDIARAVSAIVSGAFPFSTGDVFNVDGGFHLRRL
jgi:NAD(P)-dependent dehydrogenase (short-subunit alcohol dehydrogenase family)